MQSYHSLPKLLLFLIALLTSIVSAGAASSSVTDLTKTADFDAHVGKSKGALVEFFAPWCGHCKKLAPIYEELGDAFAQKKDSVIIAKVDGDANRDLSKRFSISGFPTLMWFKPNNLEPEKYNGARDLKSLSTFVEEQSGKKGQVKQKPPSRALQLDANTFHSVVNDPQKHVFVEFYAPWCGYCKQVAPVLEKVASAFENEDDCIVAQIDADNSVNRAAISGTIDISGFPTFKIFPKSSKSSPETFQMVADMDETESEMIKFINSHCFTHRLVGGGLSDLAGRMPLLDTLASKFFMAKESDRKTIVDETKDFAKRMSTSANATEAKNQAAQYYIKVMDKASIDSGYLVKESKRLSSLIEKHIAGTSVLASRKYDDIKRRINILTSFAARKMSEKAQEAAEKAIKGENLKDEL